MQHGGTRGKKKGLKSVSCFRYLTSYSSAVWLAPLSVLMGWGERGYWRQLKLLGTAAARWDSAVGSTSSLPGMVGYHMPRRSPDTNPIWLGGLRTVRFVGRYGLQAASPTFPPGPHMKWE